tara:strand:+ start:1323 stop:1730 length:408 start_codon:yes stop_codon:yes gene_type:complete
MAINVTILDGILQQDATKRGENGPLALNIKHEGRLITPRSGGAPFYKSHYMNVACWGSLRDEWDHLKEGDYVIVQGEQEWNSYEDADGVKKGSLQLSAHSITGRGKDGKVKAGEAAAAQPAEEPVSEVSDEDIPF